MKVKYNFIFAFLFIGYFFSTISFAQNNSKTTFQKNINPGHFAWTLSEPFDQKVFIENKGQFDGKGLSKSQKILFGTSCKGVELYFSATGLTYKHDRAVAMTEREIEKQERINVKRKQEEGENEKMMKAVPEFLDIEWVGSNQDVEIISEEPVSFYYTYGGIGKVNSTIKANVCKKIIYKNLYPQIDIEYIFPEGKQGIKYSLIIHPGGNISDVKMKYKNAENISLDENVNVIIESTFGNFVDHAPVSFYENDKSGIKSSFKINLNEISFSIGEYDHTRTLIIDPWTTNPLFAGYNAAYDVNYDAAGNVYIYGSYAPFELIKLNNAGVIQWVFSAVNFGFNYGLYFYYGDFAVDELSGTSYLLEGHNASGSGSRVYKVNTSGILTGTFPGDPNMNEMWRAEYNRCINQIVIGGGGIPPTNNQAAMVDTNMVNITPINVLSTPQGYHDIVLLAIDNSSSFCYMATAKSQINGSQGSFDNTLLKAPIPSLLPLSFSVSDGHSFGEVDSETYINDDNTNNGFGRRANGINGMAVSPCWLYTYDSDTLKRWDKNSGALISAIDITPTAPVYGGSNTTSIQISWGGLTADEKDNIYVGTVKTINEYNSSLSLINTFVMPDTVYDIKLGPNNKLYACGKGFVTEINVIPNTTTVTISHTNNTSCTPCNGTASASIAACGTFNYSWSTTPVQTTPTATGLCPGTYTVTLTTNCSTSFTGTVTITDSSSITATPGPNSTICIGQTATLTASGGATYTWSTGQTGASVAVTPTVTTSYSVIAATGTCSDTVFVNVTVNPLPIVTVNSATICAGQQTTTLTANGASTYSWSPATGLSSTIGTSVTANPASTSFYTVTGTDINSCVNTVTVSVTVNPVPALTVNAASICSGSSSTLTANGALTYTWSPPAGLSSTTGSSVSANPATTTNYTITGTDPNGCIDSDTTTVTVITNPVITVPSATICLGQQTATLTANGATTYSWTPATGLSSTIGTSVNANPNTTTTYTITGTINTCNAVTTTTVNVNQLPNITVNSALICAGATATLTANGATTYTWSTSATGVTINPAPITTTVYTVVGTDNNFCFNSAIATVTVNPAPLVTVNSASICIGNSATLNANGALVYTWSPPTGLSSTIGNSVAANPNVTTSYTVTGTDANNCSSTNVAIVTVNALPIITVNTIAICNGSSGTLNASGVNTYTWNPAAGLSSTNGASVSVNSNATISYSVTGTDVNGCTNVATTTVVVNPLPLVSASPPTTSGCAPLCVNFSNTTSAVGNCNWVFGDGSSSTSCTPNHCFTGQGTFYAVLTLTDNNNCTAADTATVIVYPVPLADFNVSPQPTTILDPTIHFYDASTGAVITGWNWTFGDLNSSPSTAQNPVHEYNEAGTYSAELVITSDYGCKDSILKIIIISEDYTIYVPNAFSPNYNGTNDVFMAKGEGIKDFKMYIFDRWGMQVFFSDDIYHGWDGRFQSKGTEIVQEDVYVWKIECTNMKGEPKLLKGIVSLLK